VIDFMVSADGSSWSDGVDRDGLCPTHKSLGEALYEPDEPLTAAELTPELTPESSGCGGHFITLLRKRSGT
jgi:hypothetical protein